MGYKKILNNSWIQGIIVSIISSILLSLKDAEIFKYPISSGIALILMTMTVFFSFSMLENIYKTQNKENDKKIYFLLLSWLSF